MTLATALPETAPTDPERTVEVPLKDMQRWAAALYINAHHCTIPALTEALTGVADEIGVAVGQGVAR